MILFISTICFAKCYTGIAIGNNDNDSSHSPLHYVVKLIAT